MKSEAWIDEIVTPAESYEAMPVTREDFVAGVELIRRELRGLRAEIEALAAAFAR